MRELRRAARKYDIEIDEEAARLVGHGVAPWGALERAAAIVAERRQRNAFGINNITENGQ